MTNWKADKYLGFNSCLNVKELTIFKRFCKPEWGCSSWGCCQTFQCANPLQKDRVYQNDFIKIPPPHEGEGGDTTVSLLIFPVVLWNYSQGDSSRHWNMKEVGITSNNFLQHLLLPWPSRAGQGEAGKEREVQQEFPNAFLCAPPTPRAPQTWLGMGTTTRLGQSDLFQETRMLYRHPGTHLQALWGFIYTSAININGTPAAKSTGAVVKMYPWGPRNNTSCSYPQDFCSCDPWRGQNTLCDSLNTFTAHQQGEQLVMVGAWVFRAACCGECSCCI